MANTTSTAFPHGAPTYYNTYAGSALEREQEARKRRFTEEKEEEKLPDNLLGYQVFGQGNQMLGYSSILLRKNQYIHI